MTGVILIDRYEIHTNLPLPELDTATAKAYVAKDLTHPNLMLYALKTSVFPAPRLSAIEAVIDLCHSGKIIPLVRLAYSGNISWNQGALDRSIALIYYYPGPALMQTLNDVFPPWSEERIIKKFIPSILEVLQSLSQKKISHHSLRLTNMFFENKDNQDEILVGDCISAPPGYNQHLIFEPLCYALADPISRGESTISVDFFALGVNICFLLNGGSPVDLSNERSIVFNRIESGSLATYLPAKKISTTMMELLRGLLIDDDSSRWGFREVSTWLSGGRIAQAGVVVPRRASRPINFNGQNDIYTPPLLAYEMRRNSIAALNFMDKNDLVMWLKNGLNDHLRVHLLEDMKTITLNTTSASEKLMGVLQILDSGMPLFWQGKSFTGLGLGNSLAQAVINNDPLDGFGRLISSPVLLHYLNNVKTLGGTTEEETLGRKIQMIRTSMEYQGIGGGIENCLYHLTSDIPCLSASLKSFNSLTVADIMRGLNLIGEGNKRPDLIIDRHIAAFIAARDPNVPQRLFHDMNTSNKFMRHVVTVKLLAELQHQHKIGPLPGLTKWMVDLTLPLLTHYKNIPLRKSFEVKLLALRELGHLKLIVKLLNNNKLLESDHLGLKKAQAEVVAVEKRMKEIASSLASPEHYSQTIGNNNAMVISAILSFGFAFVYIIAKMLSL